MIISCKYERRRINIANIPLINRLHTLKEVKSVGALRETAV